MKNIDAIQDDFFIYLEAVARAANPAPHHIYTHPRDDNNWKANKAFYEAVSPDVVLDLVQKARIHEKLQAELLEMKDRYEDWTPISVPPNDDLINDGSLFEFYFLDDENCGTKSTKKWQERPCRAVLWCKISTPRWPQRKHFRSDMDSSVEMIDV